MNDGTAIMRSLLLWGIPFAIVLTALAYETDWGRDIDRDATAPKPAPPSLPALPARTTQRPTATRAASAT